MKIKTIAVCYTIILLVVLAAFLFRMQNRETVETDMAAANAQYKQIEQALRSGAAREEIERRYSCQVLLQSDRDYESILFSAISQRDIVLDYRNEEKHLGKIIIPSGTKITYQELYKEMRRNVTIFCLIFLLTGYSVMLFLWSTYIKPFQRLKNFAEEVSKGNLEIPLQMTRRNYFGVFTESFDIMREELKCAREREYLANISKKELVAELSHDIKTPVATIKATCEVMQLKEQNPDTLEKVEVIAGKADMIDRLVSNLFQATLEELKMLKTEVEEESSACIRDMIQEWGFCGELHVENELPECLVRMDPLRLNQVIDNIVSNSLKYAETPIYVKYAVDAEGLRIRIRDLGPGVPREELALVAEKFYRGSNAKGKSGSGLGLYLARYFMEHMDGGFECYYDGGFTVDLFLRKA